MNFKNALQTSSSSSSSQQGTESSNPSPQVTETQNPGGSLHFPGSEISLSHLQITNHRLNGKNYLTWAQSVKLVIVGKGKWGYLTGETPIPNRSDPGFLVWSSENSTIISWLINSMEPAIGKPFLFIPTAQGVWEAVRETYSDFEDHSQLFELNSKMWNMKQGTKDVTEYYNSLLSVWQELDLFEDEAWENPSDGLRYKKKIERGRIFLFLAGLNKDLDEVRGRILGRKPMPSLREVFAEVRREEGRRNVMLPHSDIPQPATDRSALVVRNAEPDDKRTRNRSWCDHCKKPGHTKETCWKLHGKPAHIKKRYSVSKAGEGHVFQAGISDPGSASTPEELPTLKEQVEHLYKLLQAQKPSIPLSNLANSGNTRKLALLSSKNHGLWATDSGATDHMTGKMHYFSSYIPETGNQNIKLADGSFAPIRGRGMVSITPTLTLQNVLHVPSLTYSLISVSKLAHDHNCHVIFTKSNCIFQDSTSGTMIGGAEQVGGLYLVNLESASKPEALHTLLHQKNNVSEVLLLHYRLGHPNFHYMKHLYPSLFINKNVSDFQCEFCQLAKQPRNHFPAIPYKSTKPFHLIHSDVWGPSRTSTSTGHRWFVTFIDDHTRITWVYLLKEKSDVSSVFIKFYNMITTQFDTKIQIFRSDNGREFFNKTLGTFFDLKGIVHQSSCSQTPQQNGIAERKNRHLLETARSLLYTTHVPSFLWGEAILHSAYLINRLPSRVLKFQTPVQVFQEHYPTSKLLTNIPLKIFGCLVFVHNQNPSKSKLDPRAHKGIFLGYSPTQKGYKCYLPNSGKSVVSMDVIFHEHTPYYLQGENREREANRSTLQSSPNLPDLLPDIPIPVSDVPDPPVSGFPFQPETAPLNKAVPLNPSAPQNQATDKFKGMIYSRRHKGSTNQHSQTSNQGESPGGTEQLGEHTMTCDPQLVTNSSTVVVPDEYYLPIALRKGIRTCTTKHPISQFVSYDKISPSYSAFVTKSSNLPIPTRIEDALHDPKWKEAVLEEMRALEKNNTWEQVVLPSGKRPVGCKWVFTVKYNSDGSLERRKARLVAKGFTQTYGIDYSETFSPVAKLDTVRVLLTVAVNLDWPLYQLDVKNAFLHGDLQEEVYMYPPPGFGEKFGRRVCKLKKSLYGLKQSPRAWFERFTRFIKSQGYAQGHSDHTLFVRVSAMLKRAILIVYVDDIIITGDDSEEISSLKHRLAKEFEIKELGQLRYFLGMEVARSKKGIVVTQRKYVLDLLNDTGMSGCRPAETPVEVNLRLEEGKEGTQVDKERYQRLVGKLIYLSHTRPDITFAVSLVSQFMHSPCQEHLEAVYRILRYLKGTPGRGLYFKKNEKRNVELYTDADWAGSLVDRRSTSGYCSFMWGNLVTWRSKKQSVVARSTAEAEFRAMALGVCELLWLKKVLWDLKFAAQGPMKLFCDNKAAISISQNPVQHDRTKHVEIDRHFVKEKLEEGLISTPFIPTQLQTADVMTKGVSKSVFDQHIGKLGMLDIFQPT